MLHFPSANTAAHRPSARDVTTLCELLDDDVWAFSNCRVDAPGRPVAEIDWLFYNVRHGTLMVSEWKNFPLHVVTAADTGAPWLLEAGLTVPNPIEQVSKQLDALRLALRGEILPQHFPSFNPQNLKLMQSVYSPQVDGKTVIERIRWGKVYGNLQNLAGVIASSTNSSPLVLPDAVARYNLAEALCALFRTNMTAEVRAKLRPARTETGVDAVQRISQIHREIAALHAELADLVVAASKQIVAPPEEATKTKSTTAATITVTEQQRMHAHLARSFKGVNGRPAEATKALQQAWVDVLHDPVLHSASGVSVSLFGSVGSPLIKDKHGTLSKLLGMQLRKWCVLQAEAAGFKPKDVAGKPSNLRVR